MENINISHIKYSMLHYDGKSCFQTDYNNLNKLVDYIVFDLKPCWAVVVSIKTGEVVYSYNKKNAE